jgi:hypothetical protein
MPIFRIVESGEEKRQTSDREKKETQQAGQTDKQRNKATLHGINDRDRR